MNRKRREGRQTKKADNRDSSFSPSTLLVSHAWWRVPHTWTLKVLADLPRLVRQTFLPVLPPPRQLIHFTFVSRRWVCFFFSRLFSSSNLDLPLCHVHQLRGPCSALTSRHEVCEIRSWDGHSFSGLSHGPAFNLELSVFLG